MKLKTETVFFAGILAVVFLGLLGLFLLTNKPAEVVDSNSFVRDNNYFYGNKDSEVVLVEFGDFQCPACKATEPALQQVRSEYRDKIKFVFKHFPLPSHNNALITAKAAEAAGVQGKFWEMHDKIYETQDDWESSPNVREMLESYAKDLGLDVERFGSDLDSDKFNDIINKDKSDGIDVGVSATPTFFLNGEKIVGVITFEEFREKIEKKLTE
jgi:protein-disulfide isomerase